MSLEWCIFFAGVGQLVLIVGSLALPKILGWKEHLADVKPFIRQMFWVYSVYIWGTNLAFGLVSTFAPQWLLLDHPLATAVSLFIFVYWAGRVVIQFTYFDRSEFPQGGIYTLGEIALVILFLYLTFVYGWVGIRGFIL